MSIFACKKDEVKLSNKNNETTLNSSFENQKMMVFKSVDEYNQLLNEPYEKQKISLQEIKNMPFSSLAERKTIEKSLNDLNNEFVESILNNDYVVQIGNYLYKLNASEEKVYVLSSSNIDEYNDLVNQNLNNKNIRKFSTNENVIELAESGAASEKGLFCRDSYAQSRSEHFGAYIDLAYLKTLSFDCNVKYVALGIYFSLKATAKSFVQGLSYNDLSNDYPQYYYAPSKNVLLKITGQRRYKERCGNEPDGFYKMPEASGAENVTMQSYQASKGLNKYQMMCNFYVYNSNTKTWVDLNSLPTSKGSCIYPPYVTGITYGF